jgi:hypothetical protein
METKINANKEYANFAIYTSEAIVAKTVAEFYSGLMRKVNSSLENLKTFTSVGYPVS